MVPAYARRGGDCVFAQILTGDAGLLLQESLELVQRDFAGNIIWQFSRNEEITTPDGRKIWSTRQHHDWQRDDVPAGFYSPRNGVRQRRLLRVRSRERDGARGARRVRAGDVVLEIDPVTLKLVSAVQRRVTPPPLGDFRVP
jgi:hypothetical protein